MILSKEDFAARLNGRQYRKEMTPEDRTVARASRLVVIYGASDDLIEIEGLVDDEAGGEGMTYFDEKGFLPPLLEYLKEVEGSANENAKVARRAQEWLARLGRAVAVTGHWNHEGYSWFFETSAPAATFDVMEDDERYCRGLVVQL